MIKKKYEKLQRYTTITAIKTEIGMEWMKSQIRQGRLLYIRQRCRGNLELLENKNFKVKME